MLFLHLIYICIFVFRYFCFIIECKNPKACTILLRGASKDMLNEVERNLQDAMSVARNIYIEPFILPGGGAVEMAVGKVCIMFQFCLKLSCFYFIIFCFYQLVIK